MISSAMMTISGLNYGDDENVLTSDEGFDPLVLLLGFEGHQVHTPLPGLRIYCFSPLVAAWIMY